jgi:hypothetical protein
MHNVLNLLHAFGIKIDWLRLRLCIPLATLEQLLAGKFPRGRFVIAAQAPGIHVRAEIPAVGARILCAARLNIDGLRVTPDGRKLCIRIGAPSLAVGDGSVGPLADAVRKGRIDLTRPADLVGNQLGLPPLVASARGEEVVLDFACLPALREPRARRRFMVGSALLGVSRIATSDVGDATVVVQLCLFPAGLGGFVKAVLRHALMPWLDRLTGLPRGARA